MNNNFFNKCIGFYKEWVPDNARIRYLMFRYTKCYILDPLAIAYVNQLKYIEQIKYENLDYYKNLLFEIDDFPKDLVGGEEWEKKLKELEDWVKKEIEGTGIVQDIYIKLSKNLKMKDRINIQQGSKWSFDVKKGVLVYGEKPLEEIREAFDLFKKHWGLK